MDNQLKSLKEKLFDNFQNLGAKDGVSLLKSNGNSLFLAVTECGLKWQKKKIEILLRIVLFEKKNLKMKLSSNY